jgi:hypothetical protein
MRRPTWETALLPAFAWTLRAGHGSWSVNRGPGVFAHNPEYVILFLCDSVASLDAAAVAGMTRP